MNIQFFLVLCLLVAISCTRNPRGALKIRTPSEEDIQKAQILLNRLRDVSDIDEASIVLSNNHSTLIEYGFQVVNGMNHLLVYQDEEKWHCFVVYERIGGGLNLLSHMTTNEEVQKRKCWENRFSSFEDN